MRKAFVVCHAVGLITALLPAAALAQSTWTRTVSGLGGVGTYPLFSAAVVDSTIAARLEVQDRKIQSTPVVGGSFAAWHPLGRTRTSLGIRGEVSFGPAHAKAQTNPATGTFFGQPYSGSLPVPRVDGSTTLMTGAVLLGWASGRVMPYAGAGGGILRTHAKQSGLEDSDTAPSWSGIAGMAVKLGPRLSTFGEYRYTVVDSTLVIGTQTIDYRIKPNQVVAGVSVGF